MCLGVDAPNLFLATQSCSPESAGQVSITATGQSHWKFSLVYQADLLTLRETLEHLEGKHRKVNCSFWTKSNNFVSVNDRLDVVILQRHYDWPIWSNSSFLVNMNASSNLPLYLPLFRSSKGKVCTSSWNHGEICFRVGSIIYFLLEKTVSFTALLGGLRLPQLW